MGFCLSVFSATIFRKIRATCKIFKRCQMFLKHLCVQIVSARINSDFKSFIKKDFHFEKRFNTRFWGGKPLAYRINFRLQNMSKQMTSNYTWRQTSSTFLTTNRLVTFQTLFIPFHDIFKSGTSSYSRNESI